MKRHSITTMMKVTEFYVCQSSLTGNQKVCSALDKTKFWGVKMLQRFVVDFKGEGVFFNPTALKTAITLLSFGCSNCSRARGMQLCIFIFISVLNRGYFLPERIFSCRSQFYPLRGDPFLEGFCGPGKKIESHKM